MKVTVGQITDRGLNPRREVNEDSLLAMPKRGLYFVADGVGGRRGGQVASKTVVEIFTKVFTQEQTDDLRDLVAGTIDFCNQKIFEDAAANPQLQGMATTIALLAVENTRAIVAHAGDSRVYRLDDQGLILLTEDHSEVNEALRSGVISEDQAASYPRRNVINRALGAEATVEADIIEIDIDESTSFLLCSDGITRYVTDEEIIRLMRSGRTPQAICESMKEICYSGGAEDNLTAIIVDFGERQYAEEQTKPAPRIARAKAAPVTGAFPPRTSGRFVVDLAGSQTAGTQTKTQPPTNFQPVDGETTASRQKSSQPTSVPPRSTERKLPAKGNLSKLMKLSLLFLTLVMGVLIGSLFGKPISDRFERLFGDRGIYESRGITRPPENAEVKAAYARFLEGHPGEARDLLNKVSIEKPDQAEADLYLGRIEYAEGKFEEAIGHYERALKKDPNLPDIRIHLAMAYLSIGQQRTARDYLQQAIAPSSSPPPPSPTPTTVSSGERVGG